MTQLGFMAFAFVADAGEADSDCFGFFLMIGLLLLPLVPLFLILKRAMRQNRTVLDIAETQVELQREQTELQRKQTLFLSNFLIKTTTASDGMFFPANFATEFEV
jgi:hypothetical protein